MANLTARELYERLLSEPSFEASLLETCRTIELTASKRGTIVAALWAARKRPALRTLLEQLPAFGDQASLQRCVALLDTPRKLRQARAKLQAKLQGTAGSFSAKARRELQATINNLAAEEVPEAFSITSSFKKLLARLLQSIPADRLEFDLLHFDSSTRADGLGGSSRTWRTCDRPPSSSTTSRARSMAHRRPQARSWPRRRR